MLKRKTSDNVKKAIEIRFDNGNRAQLVSTTKDAEAAEIVAALELEPPKALIMVSGGAGGLSEGLQPSLLQLFSRGVARAAIAASAIIIDGGTHTGVMKLMGQGVADRNRQTPLIGVAPQGKVSYPGGPSPEKIEDGAALDPNHSHFVLIEGDKWGDETETMFRLGSTLAQGLDGESEESQVSEGIHAVTVLAGGSIDGISKDEVLNSVRHGWPVFVINGSGGLADEICKLYKEHVLGEKKPAWSLAQLFVNGQSHKEPPARIPDPAMAEIIADGRLICVNKDSDPDELKKQIIQELSHSVIDLAWARFALYDDNAGRHKKRHRRLNNWIIWLGILTTLAALSFQALKEGNILMGDTIAWWIFYILVISLPIITSIAIAAANRYKAASKWLLLRYSADTIKRKIYSYRVQVKYGFGNPAEELRAEVEKVSGNLMRTEVNESALIPYKGPIPPRMYGAAEYDDGLSPLDPDQYIEIRIGDQVNFYEQRTQEKETELRRAQWGILIAGGIGTFLAAVNLSLWVPLTTAVATAIATYLLSEQQQETIIKYNQAKNDVKNIELKWAQLPMSEKEKPENIELLVTATEEVLARELTGWIQQMEDALAQVSAQYEEGQTVN